MSESIAEMVIPGTYIEVRAEGLISVGGVSTGTIGIVGTASRGPVDTVVSVGSLAEARAVFADPDAFTAPRITDHPLTLMRALEQTYAGGAANVLAVRVANGDPVAATLPIRAAGNTDGFTLTARGTLDEAGAEVANSSGTWGRDIGVKVESDSSTGSVRWRLTLTNGAIREIYEGANVGEVRAKMIPGAGQRGSALVSVGPVSNAGSAFDPVAGTTLGVGTGATAGADGANASPVDVVAGLTALESRAVNILLVAGIGANVIGTAVLAHVGKTESEGRERIAILGAGAPGTSTSAEGAKNDALAASDDRVVVVAPGLVTTDGVTGATVTLPPSYLAAVVAGRLSTLAPQISMTNKTVPAVPDVAYSTALLGGLLDAHVLVVRQKFGSQVVKAITTSGKPFDQISIRRIVDYAKAGVRLGADPYIGRLNNPRVRAALKATLDGFLSQMVLDEMLVSYALDVLATRAQERAGICSVVMTLRPTFSIDYIRVTMNLE